tara:strand:- start:438 stop:764 length:327 start_codon:yes stop_codon:yes gene_type:complete
MAKPVLNLNSVTMVSEIPVAVVTETAMAPVQAQPAVTVKFAKNWRSVMTGSLMLVVAVMPIALVWVLVPLAAMASNVLSLRPVMMETRSAATAVTMIAVVLITFAAMA